MIRERDEEDKESDEEAPRRKHGPARKRFEKGTCPPMSVYQFFVIEKDLEPRGYDYRCTLHHSSPLDAIVKSCVGNVNLLLHMKKYHGFVPEGDGHTTKKDKQAFFGGRKAPVVSFDTTSALVLDMIIRDLRPFAITDGLGFAKMLEGFGMVVTLVYCSGLRTYYN
jgi:hypothetical protein